MENKYVLGVLQVEITKTNRGWWSDKRLLNDVRQYPTAAKLKNGLKDIKHKES